MSNYSDARETNKQHQPEAPQPHDDHEHHGCEQMLTTLGEYVDGSLGPELCAELERHMKGCNRCRVVVNTLKKTIELYHDTAEEETPLPNDVRERLYLKLHLEDFMK